MSSNIPPPITPNANTNADVTPDHNHPPTVNVVTQASQLTQEFDPVSTPAQQRNRKDLRDEFICHTINRRQIVGAFLVIPPGINETSSRGSRSYLLERQWKRKRKVQCKNNDDL